MSNRKKTFAIICLQIAFVFYRSVKYILCLIKTSFKFVCCECQRCSSNDGLAVDQINSAVVEMGNGCFYR